MHHVACVLTIFTNKLRQKQPSHQRTFDENIRTQAQQHHPSYTLTSLHFCVRLQNSEWTIRSVQAERTVAVSESANERESLMKFHFRFGNVAPPRSSTFQMGVKILVGYRALHVLKLLCCQKKWFMPVCHLKFSAY